MSRAIQSKAVKPLRLFALAALLCAVPTACAAENKYDVLAKLLMPFANLLAEKSRNPQRAVQLTAQLERMTDLPPALVGARAELVLEYPDKLRVRGPVLGETLTICRDGQKLWVSPGSKASALLQLATAEKRLPAVDPKARLTPFRLPVPEKQLVFLPALFRVEDGGRDLVGDKGCRVLGLQLASELEQSLKAGGWSARVWVGEKGAPLRLIVEQPGWDIAVRFERVEFSKSLPPTTWQPDAAESADVLKLTPGQYLQLLGVLMP
jgi:hypothetical protein